jgi:hypothetical protein
VEVLTEEVVKLENDKKALQERVESLTLSFRHRESVHAMTEKRLQTETMKLVKEREALQSTLSEGATVSTQLEMLRMNLSNALQANEVLAKESREMAERSRQELHEKKFENEKSEMKVKALQSENQRLKDEIDDIIREREEAAAALRKSIQLARGLTQRLNDEKEQREELERKLSQEQSKLQAILKAKEQVSNAMLDALHRERALQSSISKSFSFRSGEETSTPRGDPSPRPALLGGHSSPSATVGFQSPTQTPRARVPLEETLLAAESSRGRQSRVLSPSASASESSSSPAAAAVHRSTIVLSDNSPDQRPVAPSATTLPRREPQPSHDFFLTQLLSPSTPAPSTVPPLPIPQALPHRQPSQGQAAGQGGQQMRVSLVDDLTR